MLRKTASRGTLVEDTQTNTNIKTQGKNVVVPIVLWNQPPRVEVAVMHMLLLPISQPSQNSSISTTEEDADHNSEDEDGQFQVCVFAGTVDGVVLFWRFVRDRVAQANLLVFPGSDSLGEPVVGIVSGTDEWGQSTLISATRDGALARWQLPNGACAEANATLAKELAPLVGLEMLCNKRFAVVVSEESRLMVLDTWRMQLLYCMDTAQEQIRRSVAVGELQSRPKPSRPKLVRSSSGSGIDTGYNAGSSESLDSSLVGGKMSPSRLSITGGDSRRNAAFPPSSGNSEQSAQRWDAVVFSLGTEGLIKCFLWTQPRGSTNGTSFGISESGGSASVAWGFRWVLRSSWVVSWADQADDITCSQSTSLKDGDNMNPQTALMGSIKNSYFPLYVHLSPDSSLVLLIWKNKFAVLQRKWLCPLDVHSDRSPTSGAYSKARGNGGVGTCRILPEEFVRQAAITHGKTAPSTVGIVNWENGEFLEDGAVVLWTNTGHAFQFMTGEPTSEKAGKFFVFTKDQDQLVPRSDSKDLHVINKALYVTSMGRCKCCNLVVKQDKAKPSLAASFVSGKRHLAGFTSCQKTSTSLAGPTLRVVHICSRGSLGCWIMPAPRVASPVRMAQSKSKLIIARVPSSERVHFHSLTDGFQSAKAAIQSESVADDLSSVSQRREFLSHLILGRAEAQASSIYEVARRAGVRRKRRQKFNDTQTNVSGNGSSITHTASTVLATALAPVTGRSPPGVVNEPTRPETEREVQNGDQYLACRYLLDVPVIAKGFSDGVISIGLLSEEHLLNRAVESTNGLEARLSCHSGTVTAIAHCFWGFGTTKPTGQQISSPAKTTTNQPSLEETYLATEKNPFYQSRFIDSAMNRGPIHRSSLTLDAPRHKDASALKPVCSQPSIKFMVFTGGTDGVLAVVELVVIGFGNTSGVCDPIRCEARILQRFRQHRGAIQQISISPLKRNGTASVECPDRLVATVGLDRRIVIYSPQYCRQSSSKLSTGNSCQQQNTQWGCMLELSQHGDRVYNLDWHLESGLLYVECSNSIVHVWSTETGILERTMPSAMLYGGGNASNEGSQEVSRCSGNCLMETSTLSIGSATVELLEFDVLRSAEQLKSNWSSYCCTVSPSPGETPLSAFATGSMELLMLSLLLSWGVTPAIDRSCRDILGIESAHTLYSCALQDSVSGALTIPIPWPTPILPPLSESDTVALSGIEREAGSITVPAFAQSWQHSSALSANIALGIVSFCMSLMEYKHSGLKVNGGTASPMNKEEFQVLWSQLITQHSVVLPECVAHFREPALEELAAYGFDSCEYTQLAARTLLSGVIKRLPSAVRSTLSAEYSAKLHWEMVRLETETGGSFLGSVGAIGPTGGVNAIAGSQQAGNSGNSANSTNSNSTNASTNSDSGVMAFSLVVERLGSLVLLMSMIGTHFPAEISPASAREVCDVLVFLLKAPERFVASVSAELLTKGLMLFRPHLVDLSSLICQLLVIDMREKQRNTQGIDGEDTSGPGGSLAFFNDGGTGGSNAAMSLLVEVGAYESAFVLGLLQQEMHNHDRPPGFHESILVFMMELINTHYLLMCRHLPAFVDTIMACLDPTKPERRRRCLSLSTRCLHSLVRRFPMVDFHKETQRLALGTMEAVIIIYDLRTATKWRVLDGHASAVSAVRFRADGQVLVSYAARDGSVRWWNSGNAGLFGGMLKMHQSCLKEHKLVALKENAGGGAPSSTGGASAGLKQIIQTCRFHFLTRKDSNPGSPSSGSNNSDQPKHILRLTREDASQVQFLL